MFQEHLEQSITTNVRDGAFCIKVYDKLETNRTMKQLFILT